MTAPKHGTIAVVGLGYIGLPTATVLANNGWQVHGVDVSHRTLSCIASGRLPFSEPDLADAFATAVESGRLTASDTTGAADYYIVAVPTPSREDHSPDLTAVEAAVDAIAEQLTGGETIIIESTIPPGTTQRMAARVEQARPDLVDLDTGLRVHFAHVPERVLPGKIMAEIFSNNRIAGGVTPEAANKARDVYATFCTGTIYVTDAPTAELCKLAENSFRDVNIAFANELSVICDNLGTNIWELIRLANMHPRVNILTPGAGVGGHCIAIDPWFIVAADPKNSRLIRTAREVNNAKPDWVVSKVVSKMATYGTRTAIVLGLTFKPDVDDVREAPAAAIAAALANNPAVDRVLVVDPHVESLPANLESIPAVELMSLDHALGHDGVICLAVAHTAFKQLPIGALSGHGVVDACGLLTGGTQ